MRVKSSRQSGNGADGRDCADVALVLRGIAARANSNRTARDLDGEGIGALVVVSGWLGRTGRAGEGSRRCAPLPPYRRRRGIGLRRVWKTYGDTRGACPSPAASHLRFTFA